MCILNDVYVHIKTINLLLITNFEFWVLNNQI
jgi:hypothetical protein